MNDVNQPGENGDQQAPSGTPPQGTSAPVQPVASTQSPVSAEQPQSVQQDDFPKDEKEQRKAFYEMRKKIKELEEKDSTGQEDLNLIDLARGTNPSPQPAVSPTQTPQSNGMFDQSDPATLAFLTEAQKAKNEAVSARQEAQHANAQLEDFEAWQKYPFLNPKSTKTEEQKLFTEDVQKEYVTARLKAVSQGKANPRLIEVADKVKNRYEKIRSQARAEGQEEAAVTQAAKSEATRESRGTTVNLQQQGQSDTDALRRRINKGDIDATAELLKKTDPFLANWPDQ